MKVIDENTVVIYTSDELKSILEQNNSYNYIYFGDNITLINGIKISSKKTTVTIDGTYDNITYKFIDKSSLSASDTINISYNTISKVTVCNMDITGNNYYGIIYVPESNNYQNTIVEYNNITYVGPQISFNPNGTTRFIDSNITIKDTTLTTGNEVAECNKIELDGNTVINHTSKSNSAFWFRNSNPSLKILANANVSFVSESRELFYGVNNLTFTILDNSYFSVTSHSGMGYGNNGTGTTTIYPKSTFILKQTTYNDGYATWYSYGVITLREDATLNIINDYANITTSNYNIFFSSSNSGLVLNNPKEVVLYNSIANVIYSNSTSTFDFNYSRINLFSNIVAIKDNITTSNMPTYSWYKTNDLSTIKGTFTSNKTNITSHNYTSDELKELPDITNFNFTNKKIFSIGTTLLKVSALTDTDTFISGYFYPNSSVLIQYNDVSSTAVADSSGYFKHQLENSLPIGTVITFNAKEYNNLIYNTKSIEIVYAGDITIDNAPNVISFKLKPISNNPIICPKSDKLNITITDSRINGSIWKLYATIDNDLTNEFGDILKDALIFIDTDGIKHILSSNKTLVYTWEDNGNETKITNIIWNENEGILLQINNPIINNSEYKAYITWTIE